MQAPISHHHFDALSRALLDDSDVARKEAFDFGNAARAGAQMAVGLGAHAIRHPGDAGKRVLDSAVLHAGLGGGIGGIIGGTRGAYAGAADPEIGAMRGAVRGGLHGALRGAALGGGVGALVPHSEIILNDMITHGAESRLGWEAGMELKDMVYQNIPYLTGVIGGLSAVPGARPRFPRPTQSPSSSADSAHSVP